MDFPDRQIRCEPAQNAAEVRRGIPFDPTGIERVGQKRNVNCRLIPD